MQSSTFFRFAFAASVLCDFSLISRLSHSVRLPFDRLSPSISHSCQGGERRTASRRRKGRKSVPPIGVCERVAVSVGACLQIRIEGLGAAAPQRSKISERKQHRERERAEDGKRIKTVPAATAESQLQSERLGLLPSATIAEHSLSSSAERKIPSQRVDTLREMSTTMRPRAEVKRHRASSTRIKSRAEKKLLITFYCLIVVISFGFVFSPRRFGPLPAAT